MMLLGSWIDGGWCLDAKLLLLFQGLPGIFSEFFALSLINTFPIKKPGPFLHFHWIRKDISSVSICSTS